MKADKKHKIQCAKFESFVPGGSLIQCEKECPEVAVIRQDSIHECPIHGRFRIGMDGEIYWWSKPLKGHWSKQR
jgi:hypothetical protein